MHNRYFLPLAFTVGFLLVSLLTLDFYGVSWDEPLHREWGRITWAYLRTGDEDLLTGIEGAGQFYGPLYYILNYAVSEFATDVLNMNFRAANHLLTVITASLGVLLTFVLAEELTNRRAAAAAAALLVLFPPFMAHAHYNPKDIPLLTLTAATLWFATRAYHSRRTRDAALGGAFFGVAVAMKPTAVVLAPVIAGAVLADMLVRRSTEIRPVIKLLVTAGVAAIVSVYLSWPTLWRNPGLLLEAVRYFAWGTFWTGNVLYFGKLIPASELPWHYTPVMLVMTIPLVMLVLSALGSAVLARRIARGERVFAAALPLLAIILPLVLFMKPGLVRYDGMRQLFFVIPSIAIVGGAGWHAFWAKAASSRRGRRFAIAATVVIVGSLVFEVVRVFPYGGSYVNVGTRVLLGPHLETKFEVEYWGVTYLEGMRWLQQSAERNSVICVPVAAKIIGWQLDASREDLSYDCTVAPHYVMLMTRASELPWEYRPYQSRPPVFTISRLGSDLLHIYRSR